MSKYSVVSQKRRLQLIELVKKDKKTIVSAAKKLKIKISTAKSILYTFEKNGKVLKKKKNLRKQKIKEQYQSDRVETTITNENCQKNTVKEEQIANKQQINLISHTQQYQNNTFYMDPSFIHSQLNFYQYYLQFNIIFSHNNE